MKTLQKPINLLYILLALVGAVACGAPTDGANNGQLSTVEADAQHIEQIRAQLEELDKSKAAVTAKNLEDLYLKFSVDHKKDPRVTEYLYEAALLNEHYLDNFDEAFLHYSSLTDDYPESEYAQRAIFMKGMIMSEYYKKCDKAIFYFDEFIRKYPEHELVGMAKDAIDICGLSSDEIFERIEKTVP